MYHYFANDIEHKNTLLYLKLVEFFILSNGQRHNYKNSSNQELNEQPINKALEILHNKFSEDLKLEDIAKQIGISSGKLKSEIRAYTNLSFSDLLSEIRIRNACILLAMDVPTVKFISLNVGYKSIQTFYRVFEEKKGMTPENYRKKYAKYTNGKAGYIVSAPLVWEILYYMHRNFDEKLTPHMIASHFNISLSYLHKLLKANLMQSFGELLYEIRINYACGLLMSHNLTVGQIAIEVGFENFQTFSRAFQRLKKLSPVAYRQKVSMQKPN